MTLEQTIKALQSGQDLARKDGFLTPLIKQITEAALKAELEQHLEEDDQPNRKILSMFSLGMSYRDIRGHVEDMYCIDVSEATITGVTDRLHT